MNDPASINEIGVSKKKLTAFEKYGSATKRAGVHTKEPNSDSSLVSPFNM